MTSLNVSPLLDGRDFPATGGVADVGNPATGAVVAQQHCCSAADVDAIVQSSHRAFGSPAWQKLAPADRGRLLLKLADLVEARADELIELELLDTGKPTSQLRGGEIPLAAAIIRFYAGAADKIEGAVKAAGSGSFDLTIWEPYGVVAGILPWNYPLVNAAMKVAPALAAGNAIVLKPSVETPLSCVAFAKLCIEAGIPAGVVNVVLGPGSSAGNALVAHPLVKKISFTGSTAVGKAIQKLAADDLKAVNLECGGKNAIVVFDDADLDRAAEATLISAFVNAGQLCVSCSRLLVHEPIADRLEAMLVAKLRKIRVGDPRDPVTQIGPMITRPQYELALKYLDIAKTEGCRVLAGGGKLALPGSLANGLWLTPTLLGGVTPEMRVANEEIFAPVLAAIRFKTEADAVAIANRVEYGLSGSVWTRDGARALRMVRAMDTGIIWVNTMLSGYPQICVPPHKHSGTGVELGVEGLLVYCKRKSAVIGYEDQAPVGWGLG